MAGNYDVIHENNSVPIKMWTRGVPVEYAAEQQLRNIATLPFIYRHLAVMPDVHLGKGATVGSVIPTSKAIIPAAVGVDIGCGMAAIKTSLTSNDLPESLHKLRMDLEAVIPVGNSAHDDIPKFIENMWYKSLKDGYEKIERKHPTIMAKKSSAFQLGTLGGGNHFVELCLDHEQRVWIMLHSGSRNVGNRIGTYFISEAMKEMERMFITLPDKNLAYFAEHTPMFKDYIEAVSWAQEYAMANRQAMLNSTVTIMEKYFPNIKTNEVVVNCHHNYVEKENHFGENVWITRKGAIRARKGEMGIIPGSMGTKSFIVIGKGYHESFCSCSHGAGRAMSRSQANKTFTLADHILATEGVECRKDSGIIDETPMAYKDINMVMEAQKDLIEIAYELSPVLCIKG